MDRSYLIQNLINRYGEYGITEDFIEKVLEKVDRPLPYDVMHICLRMLICSIKGITEYYSINELIMAYGSLEELSKETGISIKRLNQTDPDRKIFLAASSSRPNKLMNKLLANFL